MCLYMFLRIYMYTCFPFCAVLEHGTLEYLAGTKVPTAQASGLIQDQYDPPSLFPLFGLHGCEFIVLIVLVL